MHVIFELIGSVFGYTVLHMRLGRTIAMSAARRAFGEIDAKRQEAEDEHQNHIDEAIALVLDRQSKYSRWTEEDLANYTPTKNEIEAKLSYDCREYYGHCYKNRHEWYSESVAKDKAKKEYAKVVVWWPFLYSGRTIATMSKHIFGTTPEPGAFATYAARNRELEARNRELELELGIAK